MTDPTRPHAPPAAESPAARRRRSRQHLHRVAAGIIGVVVACVAWEALVRLRVIDARLLPPPSALGPVTYDLLAGGKLHGHIGTSLVRIALGFGLGTAIGLVAAGLCYASRVVGWLSDPLIELIRGLAPLALLPAFMLLFGIGEASKVAIIVWVAWVPVFLNTLAGMRSTDPLLIKVGRSMGASRALILRSIVIPAAAPYFLAGCRLAMGSAFLVLVAAEMLGANTGLGFYILEAAQTFHIKEMYAAIVVIGVLGLAINGLFVVTAVALTPWSQRSA